MLKSKHTFLVLMISGLLINSCGTFRKNKQSSNSVDYSLPSTLIYKTKNDYYFNVPITLSNDKSSIVSYPAISDIYYKGYFAYPTKLNNGYLLDNRGISENTAFLRFTYEEYSKLPETPTLSELYNQIIDFNPLTELYNLGNRYRFNDEILEINNIIKNNNFKQFKKLK